MIKYTESLTPSNPAAKAVWKSMEYLSGSPSGNRSSVRIRIPRSQRLTPESLLTLIENVKTGEW
ncbi:MULTISPECIES: DUF4365 domain-containing protein [Nostocales]|uniref:DUF4365 domain-containing protein n=1 Tax=Nostocales TaxID=1161 RepID=UPI000496ABD6|nr:MULTISPECIES: DUF4365 domain-containing protein [Nostocales]